MRATAYKIATAALTAFSLYSVYAQSKADMAYKTLLRESLGSQILLALTNRNNFEAQAQIQYKELAERYNAAVAKACAMENLPIDQCLFDVKAQWVIRKPAEPPKAPAAKK